MSKGKKIGSVIVLSGLVLAVGFGAVVFRSAQAAEAVSAGVLRSPAAHGPGLGGETDEYLAAALEITTDELDAAREQAQTAALAQAVEQGLITQAQADRLQSGGRGFPFGPRGRGWLADSAIDYDALLAEALDISVEELNAARAEAFTARIDQAVSDGNLTQEKADLLKGQYALANNAGFQTSMQSAYQAAVTQAVASGVITQAQADQLLAERSSMRFLGGPRLGGRGGHGGHGFRPGHSQPSGDTTTTPTP